MGTLLAVTLLGGDLAAERRHLDTVFDTATECEHLMSAHRADSVLARVNEGAGRGDAVETSELASALEQARQLAELTGGAFDPTIGPVLRVWRRAARRGSWPSPRRLEAARARVGWQAIEVSGSRVALSRAGVSLDLGGFGKGVTLDLIAARLAQRGCRAALLNFGESSLVAIGRPLGERWWIALRHPRGDFAGEFPLGGRACSTSATFGQSLRIGGRRVGHVFDPRTGRPLRERAQVTVLARSAAVAEAASTALLVRGRGEFATLARRWNVDACWIDDAGLATTPWFPLRRLQAAS